MYTTFQFCTHFVISAFQTVVTRSILNQQTDHVARIGANTVISTSNSCGIKKDKTRWDFVTFGTETSVPVTPLTKCYVSVCLVSITHKTTAKYKQHSLGHLVGSVLLGHHSEWHRKFYVCHNCECSINACEMFHFLWKRKQIDYYVVYIVLLWERPEKSTKFGTKINIQTNNE